MHTISCVFLVSRFRNSGLSRKNAGETSFFSWQEILWQGGIAKHKQSRSHSIASFPNFLTRFCSNFILSLWGGGHLKFEGFLYDRHPAPAGPRRLHAPGLRSLERRRCVEGKGKGWTRRVAQAVQQAGRVACQLPHSFLLRRWHSCQQYCGIRSRLIAALGRPYGLVKTWSCNFQTGKIGQELV